MEYNTTRQRLLMGEYGRYIQKIVHEICHIKDREERTRAAYSTVELMNFFSPQFKNIEEYRHKLWDHLIIMSDYKLDVDAPYPIPTREEKENAHPAPLPYPADKIKYRHYGRNVETLIEKALAVPDVEKRKRLAGFIANYMKIVLAQYDKDTATDEQIASDLRKMSNGELVVEQEYAIEQKNPRFFDAPVPTNTHKKNNNNFKKKKSKFFFKKKY